MHFRKYSFSDLLSFTCEAIENSAMREKKNSVQLLREIILFDSTCLNCHNDQQDKTRDPHVSGAELKKNNVRNKMVL